ncbi:hypothetical protein HCN44_000750 [Aphidius gifuensis]|uniref:G domain-containing protein n=1 Tax=Aphidius gifuensis TaxID=684658 RepID=A0A834XPG2_APHGI|nr:hypothetical protein HCN44_000750 [Aphidius gifuensis]
MSTNTDNLYRNKRDTPCIPGEEPLTVTTNVSEINDNSSSYTVFSIMNSLNQGTKNIKYSSNPNIILLLGLSGAGKSTLAQYLFGNNSNLISVAKKNSWCEATGDFYIEDKAKKIGHNSVLSHTELPDLLIDPETNIPIYDCPGFSDTRDPEHDISGAYFIKAVTDKAKTSKFIFVVNYNSVTIGANREEFMTLARHATNMINNISKYRESIALVATKIKDDKSDKQRIIAITDFLQGVRRTLKNTNKEPSVQLFIDILLTTSGPNNRDYTRIGFMPKFDTEGPLIDMPVVQAHKKSLRTIIYRNMVHFTIIDPTDLKPSISRYRAHRYPGECNQIAMSLLSYEAPASEASYISPKFIDECFRYDEYKAAGIYNVIVDKFKLDLLKQLINNTLNHDESSLYSSYTPDHLVLRGHYVKLSDLYKYPQVWNAKFVEIFALKKIFIDYDIHEHFSMSIIAPTWEILSRININLSGKPGDAHTQQKATSGSSVSKPHGEDGAPGLPGGPGGNFVGIGATFIDSHYLSISVDGGRGGPGQDGGNGMDGTDDTECPDTIKDANYPRKLGCRSSHFADSNRLYDQGCSAQSNFDGYSIDIRTIDTYTQRVTCYPKNDGPFKGNGTNGGNGGKGGEGGYPGRILVIAKNNHSIYTRNQVGNTGLNGKSGVGGNAGEKKRKLVINNELYPVDILDEYDFDNSEQDYKYVKSEGSYFPGNSGIDGYNDENIKHPERALLPSNFVHQSIVDYKTFAHKYSSGNTEDVDLIDFLNFLETN